VLIDYVYYTFGTNNNLILPANKWAFSLKKNNNNIVIYLYKCVRHIIVQHVAVS